MSEAILTLKKVEDLSKIYKEQISSIASMNSISYANYSDQYSNNSGGSYTNSK